jgi:hypothetical protein
MSVRQWEGSTDPADKSGFATIVVRGKDFRIKLESFNDFLDIGFALESEFKLGRETAADELNRLIGNVFRDKFGVIPNAGIHRAAEGRPVE